MNVILIASIIIFIGTVIFQIQHGNSVSNEIIKSGALKDAERMGRALMIMRAKYTSEVVAHARTKGKMNITHDYLDPKYDTIGGAIPLPATLSMQIAESMSDSNTQVNLYSKYPFPWRKERAMSEFQAKAFDHFVKNRDSNEPYFYFNEEEQVLHYAIPDKMTVIACVDCHNKHPQSPKKDWALGDVRGAISISLPMKHDKKVYESNNKSIFSLVCIIIATVMILGTLEIKRRRTQKAITILNESICLLEKGEIPEKDIDPMNNELSILSSGLNSLKARLQETSEFAKSIGSGDLDAEFDFKNEHDILGSALKDMQKELKDAVEEDRKRNWATTGFAQFGEILQMEKQDIKSLSSKIISALVQYMKADQGVMYMLQEENGEENLVLMAFYAFENTKPLEATIRVGEGILGQCVLEKQTLYLTDVPENYMNITSGLGKAKPSCILIFPLKINEEVLGVIEMASFSKLEKYEIEFAEKLSENIAVTLKNLRILEQSKAKTEALAIHEEKLRQNMEELQSIQEEMTRQEKERLQEIELLKAELYKLKG